MSNPANPTNTDRVLVLAADLRAQCVALGKTFDELRKNNVAWVKYARSADEIMNIAATTLEQVTTSLAMLQDVARQSLRK